MNDISWTENNVALKDLVEYEHNPRRISKKDFDELVLDIKRDGYHNRIKINLDNVIIGGDKRKKALEAAGFSPNEMIPVLMPSRMLTIEEFKRLNIQDNLHRGSFDFDILANEFDSVDLVEWGMPDNLFPKMDNLTLEDTEPACKPSEKKIKEVECPSCQHKFSL